MKIDARLSIKEETREKPSVQPYLSTLSWSHNFRIWWESIHFGTWKDSNNVGHARPESRGQFDAIHGQMQKSESLLIIKSGS
jgi:hypothetical protein